MMAKKKVEYQPKSKAYLRCILLKARSKRQILVDNMRVGPPPRSVLTVLVDTTQHKGYYLKTLSPRDLSAYAYSCKLLEQILRAR